MNEALTRILGLKAHMGLHKKAKEEIVPGPDFWVSIMPANLRLQNLHRNRILSVQSMMWRQGVLCWACPKGEERSCGMSTSFRLSESV